MKLSPTVMVCFLALAAVGCKALEERLFTRMSPTVDTAVSALGSNDAGIANRALTEYLNTGHCHDGELGTPPAVREHAEAALDLGLTLFQLAERYGQKFGTPPTAPGAPGALGAAPAPTGPSPEESALLVQRSARVDCALRVVRIIAADSKVAPELRAEAYYLSGNLEFLRHDYESAVDSYGQALSWQPGGSVSAASDLGTRAAWNRAIALRRIEEQEKNKPPPSDAGAPPQDGGSDDDSQKDDSQKDDSQKDDAQKDDAQKDDSQKDDSQKDDSQKDDSQKDDSQKDDSEPDKEEPEPSQGDQANETEEQPAPAGSAPPPSLSQDQHILDELERAPMLQNPAQRRRGRAATGMEDK